MARLGVVVNDAPIVLPVNYRLVESLGPTWLTIRTRPGNVIDRGGLTVALEIDDIDPASHEGWSVLVRGTLSHVDPDAADFRGASIPNHGSTRSAIRGWSSSRSRSPDGISCLRTMGGRSTYADTFDGHDALILHSSQEASR